MLNLLPYALGAYGASQGYQRAKDAGASGIGRLLGGLTGAAGGYTLGSTGLSVFAPGVQQIPASSIFANIPGMGQVGTASAQRAATDLTRATQAGGGVDMSTVLATAKQADPEKARTLADILLRQKGSDKYDPLKIAALAGGIPFALGAFDQAPTDMFQPTYNLAYAKLASERPKYSYIDPVTGQEKEYSPVYIPEADPANQGAFQSGPYAIEKTRLREGGLAEIKKFNEGGINYLPSKVSHDEDDANNYVRASGYVEDGSGSGDKDEDTMLAQLADGEFVTRADGVLGAGIIAGANPSSIKDMRDKGAKYFYEQQARYKRVFDLLKEKNGISKQKTN